MNIIITNVFGVKNKGDQVLFEALLDCVSGFEDDCLISAVATNPRDNEKLYSQVDWVGLPWTSSSSNLMIRRLSILIKVIVFIFSDLLFKTAFFKLSKIVKSANYAIACPGGYFEDSTWSYFAHALQLLLCKRHGVRYVLAPQSIGPVRNRFGRAVLRFVLADAAAVFCREKFSYTYTSELLGDLGQVHLTTDMALFAEKILAKPKLETNKHCVGITVLDWGCRGDADARSNYISVLNLTIKELEKIGKRVIVIPQTTYVGSADAEVAEQVIQGTAAVVGPQPETLDLFLQQFDQIDTIIGMRLHSCLIALMRGVPAISISYLPKCSEIMSDLGLSNYVIDVERVQSEQILSLVEQLDGTSNRRSYFKRFEDNRSLFKCNENVNFVTWLGADLKGRC